MRWLLVGTLVMTLATHVRADDDARARAAARFDEGKALYQTNQFRLAVEKFTQAYELEPDPVYLFNIAQSYRNAADCERAFEFYTRYLVEDPDAANADSVRAWLSELRPCAERIKALIAEAAAPPPVVPQPVAPSTVEVRSSTIDRGGTLRAVGLASAGVGAIGLVAGIIYSVKSQGYENEIGTACSTQCQWDDLQTRDAAGRTANTLSLVGYIAGSLVLGVGVGVYIVGRARVERVTVSPTTAGAQVSAQVSF